MWGSNIKCTEFYTFNNQHVKSIQLSTIGNIRDLYWGRWPTRNVSVLGGQWGKGVDVRGEKLVLEPAGV